MTKVWVVEDDAIFNVKNTFHTLLVGVKTDLNFNL